MFVFGKFIKNVMLDHSNRCIQLFSKVSSRLFNERIITAIVECVKEV